MARNARGRIPGGQGHGYFSIYRLTIGDDGEISARSNRAMPVIGDSIVHVRKILRKMLVATEKPVVDNESIPEDGRID